MTIVRIVTSLFFVGVLGYIIWTNWSVYRTTTGTTYERIWETMKGSATIFWNRFVIFLAAIVAQLDNIADFFNMPELKNYINIALGNPKTVALIMLVISSLTIVARLRPKSKDPLQ